MTKNEPTAEELIEAIRARGTTVDDVEAFEERCRKREEKFAKEAERTAPDADFYNFRYGVKNTTRNDINITPKTLKLARLVAEQPPLPDDKKSIEEWAKRLAADISKGRD